MQPPGTAITTPFPEVGAASHRSTSTSPERRRAQKQRQAGLGEPGHEQDCR
jgi:hypothetical protein